MRARSIVSLVCACACVLGYRGEAMLDASWDVAGVVAVRIDLPSTPIEIVACDVAAPVACPETLAVVGRVLSTGGTAKEARAHAEDLALLFEREDGLASLRAEIPLAARGLVELEIERIDVPGDRDLDVRTSLGDVSVVGARGAVSVDVDTGDVAIEDGDGGVAVRLRHGRIDAATPGDADLVCEAGDVALVQTGDARDAYVRAAAGDVRIELADDAALDLDLHAGGTIRVTTTTIVSVTDGELVREVGEGTTRVEVHASGDVTIVRR
ncbi:MAG TPA: DUF4097 family beta strand repeat-containing protein [Nannocystaceae bacterium]|nr:DUF4097 family beta strand repeat-containing protein [Nannocystaceae bacterium]